MTTTTPYSDGWVAAHKGKPMDPAARGFYYWSASEWERGYDDAKSGKIDAKAFLGPEFQESNS